TRIAHVGVAPYLVFLQTDALQNPSYDFPTVAWVAQSPASFLALMPPSGTALNKSVRHLLHPFPVSQALPRAFEYYGCSVTIGVSSRRCSTGYVLFLVST